MLLLSGNPEIPYRTGIDEPICLNRPGVDNGAAYCDYPDGPESIVALSTPSRIREGATGILEFRLLCNSWGDTMTKLTIVNRDADSRPVELTLDLQNQAVSLSAQLPPEISPTPITASFDSQICGKIVQTLNDCLAQSKPLGRRQIPFRDALTREPSWFYIGSHSQAGGAVSVSWAFSRRETDYELSLDKNDGMQLARALSDMNGPHT